MERYMRRWREKSKGWMLRLQLQLLEQMVEGGEEGGLISMDGGLSCLLGGVGKMRGSGGEGDGNVDGDFEPLFLLNISVSLHPITCVSCFLFINGVPLDKASLNIRRSACVCSISAIHQYLHNHTSQYHDIFAHLHCSSGEEIF